MIDRPSELSFQDWELWEWDWGITKNGRYLHHAADLAVNPEYGESMGDASTSCGRKLFLMIPGIATRMGADRCPRCCAVLGYPAGVGSPKNDEDCRPIVELRLGDGKVYAVSDEVVRGEMNAGEIKGNIISEQIGPIPYVPPAPPRCHRCGEEADTHIKTRDGASCVCFYCVAEVVLSSTASGMGRYTP